MTHLSRRITSEDVYNSFPSKMSTTFLFVPNVALYVGCPHFRIFIYKLIPVFTDMHLKLLFVRADKCSKVHYVEIVLYPPSISCYLPKNKEMTVNHVNNI